MLYFFIGLVLLSLGYFIYGRFLEKMLVDTSRETPAKRLHDGVDFVELPTWKNMLIQLLNIAGVGPVIGVILGIKFGAIVFLIIPIGNIIAGATHDFLAGMISLREDGANLPKIIRQNLGKTYYGIFSVIVILLLLLVVAVFINIPAVLIDSFFPNASLFWLAVLAIFIYYIIATLFSIDKIIGRIYPVFGALLLIGTGAMFVALIFNLFKNPELLSESAAFKEKMFSAENNNPIIPMLFVTIACGIISGFHGTQSPIIARTLKSENHSKRVFYGSMIIEGIIAMVWAGAGLAMYNMYPELMSESASAILDDITIEFLGSYVGVLTIITVIILAITSGDTALRSLRLTIAEMCKVEQKSFSKRIAITLPVSAIVLVLLFWSIQSAESFKHLWNYFAWGNQILAASTLMAAVVWLRRYKKNFLVALVPAVFMTFIVLTYILWISPAHGGAVGFGLDLNISYIIAGILTLILAIAVTKKSSF